MKIGIWTDGIDRPEISGPWLALLRMLRELQSIEHGHDVHFLRTENSRDMDIFQEGTSLLVSKSLKGKWELYSHEFDVILVNGIPSTLRGALFHQYGPDVNKIAWVHGTGPWANDYEVDLESRYEPLSATLRKTYTKMIMRRVAPSFDVIVSQSNFCRDTLRAGLTVPERRIQTIQYGVDSEKFRPSGNGQQGPSDHLADVQKPFLFAFGYGRRKNPKTVLRALAELHARGCELSLVIGGGRHPEHQKLQRMIRELELEDSVTFTGHVSSEAVASIYREASVFVFPSLHENFGMPILEAMASECPVITSNAAACPEVAGDAALLLNDPTSYVELADAIEEITTNQEWRDTLIQRGKKRSREFCWRRCAQKFVSLFDRIEEA